MQMYYIFNPDSEMKTISGTPGSRFSKVTHWEDDKKVWSNSLNNYSDRICIPQYNYYCGPSLEEFVARIEHYLPKESDVIITTNRIVANLEDEGYTYRFNYGIVQGSEIRLIGTKTADCLMDLMLGLEVDFRDIPYDEYLEKMNDIMPITLINSDYISIGNAAHNTIHYSYKYNPNITCKI